MHAARIAVGGLLLVAGTLGCEAEGDPAQVVIGGDRGKLELLGFFTGVAEIGGLDDVFSTVPGGARTQTAFAFAVALRLFEDGRFAFWSFGFPIPGGGDLERERVCTGVFARDFRTLTFFPNQICRALPLNRFTIGRTFTGGLLLEARSRPTGLRDPVTDVADIRVRIRLDRESH